MIDDTIQTAIASQDAQDYYDDDTTDDDTATDEDGEPIQIDEDGVANDDREDESDGDF